ncbi:prenyltransferase [Kitasatospora viridis]|uniref:1,4-dihydroxy-2-naphthoate prenyltransferase n=1 Tax=Kitasatospora viridis TaxID=281105 RepID=A0A561UCK5_9ACTN|nr:prenyltransferase [Kitasatospora viridis]TWF97080.1 1,4-dihydroxy-2-naphthoate prenyltransferase [Kitasatospora viridis]
MTAASPAAAPGHQRAGLRAWVVAAGPPLVLVIVLQGLYAVAAARHVHPLTDWRVLLTLLVLVPDCIGRRYVNDYEDYVRGLDRPDGVRPESALAQGLDMRRLRLAGLGCFALAWVGLAVLAAATNLWLLPAIALCYLGYFGYAGGPRPLGHRAMGELLDFVVTGTGVTLILTWLNAGRISADLVLASLGPGFLFAALMLHNNARDVEKDRAAGKTTLPHVVSAATTKILYAGCLAGFYAVDGLLVWRFDSPAMLLPLLTLPWAGALVWSFSRSRIGPSLISWAWLYYLMIADFVLFSIGAWL